MTKSFQKHCHGGFTLVELLVALMVLALIALMSWRGVDAMIRAQRYTQAHLDRALTVQTALAQWSSDLDAVASPQVIFGPTLYWDGKAFRMVRYSQNIYGQPGLLVVAWASRAQDGQTQWFRWQSEWLQSYPQVQTALATAELWSKNPDDIAKAREVLITSISDWHVYFHRSGGWSHPASSSNAPLETPDAVRLQLVLPEDGRLSGTITQDWLAPTAGGRKT